MDDLAYTELKMQKYLKNEDIPVNEAQNLLRFRTRAAHFKGNYGDRYENKACPLCSVHLDTQNHSMQCQKVNKKINIQGKYSDIFRGKIPTNISKTLLKISKLRGNYIWIKKVQSYCMKEMSQTKMRPLCAWLPWVLLISITFVTYVILIWNGLNIYIYILTLSNHPPQTRILQNW